MTNLIQKFFLGSVLSLSLGMGASFVFASGSGTKTDTNGSERYAPDNTGKNSRDASGDTLTAQDQPEKKEDRDLTQRIREEIVKDDSLSVNAKNIKIITINGVVTLRGPVESSDEKAKIVERVTRTTGVVKVQDQLEAKS